jgi:hypothetical protein
MTAAQAPTPSEPSIRLDGARSRLGAMMVAALLLAVVAARLAAIEPGSVAALLKAGSGTLVAMAIVGSLPFFATVGPLELQVRFLVSSMLRVFIAAIGFVGGQFLASPPPVIWMLTCFAAWAAMSALDARKLIRLSAGAHPASASTSALA